MDASDAVQHELISLVRARLRSGELVLSGPSTVVELPTGRTIHGVPEQLEIVVFAPSTPPGALGAVTGGLVGYTTDPLSLLLYHLARGAPSAAWLRRWSLDGDPLQAAWRATRAPDAMALILTWAGAPVAPLFTFLHLSGLFAPPPMRSLALQIVPDGPALAVALAGRDRLHAAPRDPLADMLDAIATGVDRWDVAAAWPRSSYVPGMFWVLENAVRRGAIHQLSLELVRSHTTGTAVDVPAAIRALLPEPPPLDQLLARRAVRIVEEDPFAD